MSDAIEKIKRKIIETSAELVEATVTDTIIPLDEALAVIDEESAKEPQECNWTKGIHSVETCWGDIDVKTFNQFKRQGAKFCPYCGRKIKGD
jgi:alkyl hydroperoxide reductase subunit AhpF